MGRKRLIVMTLAIFVSLAFVAAAAQWKPEIKFLKIGVATAGGDWFRAGAKFSTIVSEAIPELSTTTLMGGGIVNVKNVAKGDAQLAFSVTPYPENGYHGRHEFKEPLTNLRLMAATVGRRASLCLVVLKDSPIKTLAGIKGKRITPGDRGWATTHLAESLMTAAGMPPEKFKAEGGTISYLSITDRAKAILADMLGESATLFKEKVNYKVPGCRPDKLHQDQAAGWNAYSDFFITMGIMVDANRKDNAALSFMSSGNYKKELMGPEWQVLTHDDPPYKPENEYMLIEGGPGDVIFFDSYVPHGSPSNTSSESRRNVFLTFNRASDGDMRMRYYQDKWKNYAPNKAEDARANTSYRV